MIILLDEFRVISDINTFYAIVRPIVYKMTYQIISGWNICLDNYTEPHLWVRI